MIEVPIDYIEANGKKWLFIQSSLSLQCAYCIHMQPLMPVRDSTGLVVSLKVREESHDPYCPQADKKI
jgi:hypothetical protein